MDKIKLGAGVFPSITFNSAINRVQVAWQDGSSIVLTTIHPDTLAREGDDIEFIGGGAGAYPEVYAHVSALYLAYRDGADPFFGRFGVHNRTPEALGQIHGSRPSVLGEGKLAYISGPAAEGYPVRMKDVTALGAGTIVRHAAGTGLSRITGGHVVTIDEDRSSVAGISDPSFAGDAVVGTTDHQGKPTLKALRGDQQCFIGHGEDSQNPRMCTDGKRFFIVAWGATGEGVRLWRVLPEDFSNVTNSPFGVPVDTGKALGYFFGRRSKYGQFDLADNCAILPLDAWQDSDGSLPPDVGDQIRQSILDSGRAIVSNTAIHHAAPEWARVIGVFAGRQEGNVWVHEPTTRAEADQLVKETRQQIKDAGLPARPVIVILREERSTDPQFIGVSEALAPEIYFTEPESSYDQQLNVARARIADVCRAFSPLPLYLCVQAFDRAKTSWKNNPAALEAIQQAANESITQGQIKGLMWFAFARPGGVLSYPQLEPWHVAQIAVTPSPSTIVDPTEPVDPDPPSPSHPEEDVNEAEVRSEVSGEIHSSRVPRDIAQGAMIRFNHEVVWDRDRVGEDNISGGAQYIYFWPAYYAEIGARLAKAGPPQGSPEQVYATWGDWSYQGFKAAANFYWSEQGVPPGKTQTL